MNQLNSEILIYVLQGVQALRYLSSKLPNPPKRVKSVKYQNGVQSGRVKSIQLG